MTYNIVLICQNGASTTILVDKMLASANSKGIDVVINAYPEHKLEFVVDEADLVLLAPQIRHKKKAILEKYSEKNVPFMSVDPMDYGMMDGEKVLDLALKELEKEGRE